MAGRSHGRAYEGEVGGRRRVAMGKTRAKLETQENSLGKCYFVGMDVIAICFSVGMKDTFSERLQVVGDIRRSSNEFAS